MRTPHAAAPTSAPFPTLQTGSQQRTCAFSRKFFSLNDLRGGPPPSAAAQVTATVSRSCLFRYAV